VTMSDEILSQDEVDALLKGVTGDEDIPEEVPLQTGIQPYNLAKQERIVRGRMPALEIINERFARAFRMSMYSFTRRGHEVSTGAIKVQKYAEFLRNLVVPTNINICTAKPLHGSCLIIFDPSLIFLTVDSLFGGDGRFHTRIEGREFTATEIKIIHRMLDMVFKDYGNSWKTLKKLHFETVRSEINPQFANIATPTEVVVSTSFNIEMGSASGAVHICMPYTMIEPVRDQLMSTLHGETLETDARWHRTLRAQLESSSIELVAPLAKKMISVEELIAFESGDIIPIEIEETIQATVDGLPVIEASYGTHRNRYSLKVKKVIRNNGTANTEE
jgi:flagellar motor switch protein FliM